MEVEIEIMRPVNPAGVSFIKNIYGAVASRNRKVIDNYKREFTKLVTRLGYKIEETVGTGKMVTGVIVLEIDDDGRPIRAYTREIKVWGITKELSEKIEVVA